MSGQLHRSRDGKFVVQIESVTDREIRATTIACPKRNERNQRGRSFTYSRAGFEREFGAVERA